MYFFLQLKMTYGGGSFYSRRVKAFSLCGKVSSTGCNKLTLKKVHLNSLFYSGFKVGKLTPNIQYRIKKRFPFNMLEFSLNHKETVFQTSQIGCSETFFPTWIDNVHDDLFNSWICDSSSSSTIGNRETEIQWWYEIFEDVKINHMVFSFSFNLL